MIDLNGVRYLNADGKELDLCIEGKGIHGIYCKDRAEAVKLAEIMSGCREPLGGSVSVFDERAATHRAKIGVAFADMPYYTDMTVYETLEFVGSAKKIASDKLARQIKEATELLGIEKLANARIASISAKGRRALSIAQALLGNPDFLVFESISDGLDERTLGEIRETLSLLGSMKCVALISTDDAFLLDVCDNICVVIDGALCFEGTSEELSARLMGGKRLCVRLKGSENEIAITQAEIAEINGVERVLVNKDTVTVSYDDSRVDRDAILMACERYGCTVRSVNVLAKAVGDVFALDVPNETAATEENEEENE